MKAPQHLKTPRAHLQHELVEMHPPLLVALEALEEEVAAETFAPPDVAVDVQSFRDPRLSWTVDLVTFGLIEDSI